jgi:hypothetical protein
MGRGRERKRGEHTIDIECKSTPFAKEIETVLLLFFEGGERRGEVKESGEGEETEKRGEHTIDLECKLAPFCKRNCTIFR